MALIRFNSISSPLLSSLELAVAFEPLLCRRPPSGRFRCKPTEKNKQRLFSLRFSILSICLSFSIRRLVTNSKLAAFDTIFFASNIGTVLTCNIRGRERETEKEKEPQLKVGPQSDCCLHFSGSGSNNDNKLALACKDTLLYVRVNINCRFYLIERKLLPPSLALLRFPVPKLNQRTRIMTSPRAAL